MAKQQEKILATKLGRRPQRNLKQSLTKNSKNEKVSLGAAPARHQLLANRSKPKKLTMPDLPSALAAKQAHRRFVQQVDLTSSREMLCRQRWP